MVPLALDLELEKVLAHSAPQRDFPLAVRRFMHETGMSQPEEAMQCASLQVLRLYAATISDDVGAYPPVSQIEDDRSFTVPVPVSVERLCFVTGVDLMGAPRRRDRSVNKSDREIGSYQDHAATVEFATPRPVIRLSPNIGWNRGRVAAAHEIGHVLIHRRDSEYDQATIRLGSTPAEEALAEYAARLLLLPRGTHQRFLQGAADDNYAALCVRISQRTNVTIHAAVARLGDPDAGNRQIRGAIFWRMQRNADREIQDVLTPHWHLCPSAYIPVGKCKARRGSLIAELAQNTEPLAGTRIEQVNIGSLAGEFSIDAFAWGSVLDRTRVVLSIFSTCS
jgi:hypothetical protein